MWRAWHLDVGTWAVIIWLAWFAGWETCALARGSYLDTFTAHLRPVFLTAPVTWWIALGLWGWIGVHMLAPDLEPLDTEVLAAAQWVKVIARAGIGLDNVDVEAATRHGIVVCNAPRAKVVSAAEHTIALLLALARNIPRAHTRLAEGRWERDAHRGVELCGKTLGIVGLGRVGQLVAERCSAFGMQLLVHDPYVSVARAADLGAATAATLHELCRAADVVTVHLPKTPGTVGLIGDAELRMMKPSALVINTSRGGIVDEDALHTALVDGWIAGAGLDVFVDEPATESPLIKLDNVVVTPHLGASTNEAQDKAGLAAAELVRSALTGELVPGAVNLPVRRPVPKRVEPFLGLGERLGRLCGALSAGGPAGEVCIEFCGLLANEATEALSLATIRGLVAEATNERVTSVNAPRIADGLGLRVLPVDVHEPSDHMAVVRLRAGEATVAGTLGGSSARHRLVELSGLAVDVELTDHLVCLRYDDRPGVVGTVGAELGAAGVNIASMQVARDQGEGEAVMVLGVSAPAPTEVLGDLAALIGAAEIHQVDLGPAASA